MKQKNANHQGLASFVAPSSLMSLYFRLGDEDVKITLLFEPLEEVESPSSGP